MLQAFPDAALFVIQGGIRTANAPSIPPKLQTNGFGAYPYTTNGDYSTFHTRQGWTTTPQSVHWSGLYEPCPPNVNASFFASGRFHVSPPSPLSSSSTSSVSPMSTAFPSRQTGASATGYCDSHITACTIDYTSTTHTSVRDTSQFLNRNSNHIGDWSVSREVVDTVKFSKYTVLGRIQETGNGLSALQVLKSIASLIEAEPLPSREKTANEIRMKAVEHICGAFDALKRTGNSPQVIGASNGTPVLAEARAEEAARLLMGLIKLGVMKPGDLTIPVKIIFESDRRYLYLAKALLKGGKSLSFNYTTVNWLRSMAADLQDAQDIKYIISQIKTPPRPHRY